MTYLDKYPSCIGCPVSKYCGTAVGSIRLCNSYNDSMSEKESASILTPSEAALDLMEQDYIYEQLAMWDNITD